MATLKADTMAPLIIALAPLGIEVIRLAIEIIQKDAVGEVTPSDWIRLLIPIKSMEVDLAEVLVKLNPPK